MFRFLAVEILQHDLIRRFGLGRDYHASSLNTPSFVVWKHKNTFAEACISIVRLSSDRRIPVQSMSEIQMTNRLSPNPPFGPLSVKRVYRIDKVRFPPIADIGLSYKARFCQVVEHAAPMRPLSLHDHCEQPRDPTA
jgi:hypothetical protein